MKRTILSIAVVFALMLSAVSQTALDGEMGNPYQFYQFEIDKEDAAKLPKINGVSMDQFASGYIVWQGTKEGAKLAWRNWDKIKDGILAVSVILLGKDPIAEFLGIDDCECELSNGTIVKRDQIFEADKESKVCRATAGGNDATQEYDVSCKMIPYPAVGTFPIHEENKSIVVVITEEVIEDPQWRKLIQIILEKARKQTKTQGKMKPDSTPQIGNMQ